MVTPAPDRRGESTWAGNRAGASRGKLTGLYLRGKTFWFTHWLDGEKKFKSLGTTDYGEVVRQAQEIYLKPELAPAAVFAREVNR